MSRTKRLGLDRRNFLRAAAGAAAAYPFLKAAPARAADETPQRLVIYVSGQGNLMSRWTPAQLPNNQLQLSEMLAPLSAHKEKLTVLSGVSNRLPSLHTTNGHNAANLSLLTANLIDTTGTGVSDPNTTVEMTHGCLGPSIDHYLAQQMGWNRPINLAIGSPGLQHMFYQVDKSAGPQSANRKAALLSDAYEVYNTFLGGNSSGAPQLSRADLFRSRRGSILQSVLGAFDRLNERPQLDASLSAADRSRLSGHRSVVGQLQSEANYVPPASCEQTTLDIESIFPGYSPTKWNDKSQLDRHSQLMIELAVATLKCGASNVVTLHDTVSHSPPFEFLNPEPLTDWHAQVHNDGTPYGHSDDNPILKAGFLYYASQFNNLLSRLDSVQESNGKTMLDNSVVVWISELSVGQTHSTSDLPIVLAGGGTQIAGNRHLHRSGANTGELYASLLQAFGLSDTTFGHVGSAGGVDLNRGPIQGLVQ